MRLPLYSSKHRLLGVGYLLDGEPILKELEKFALPVRG